MSLGSFKNVRTEFSWEGHTLELDETAFQHGTLYELECESVGHAIPMQYALKKSMGGGNTSIGMHWLHARLYLSCS